MQLDQNKDVGIAEMSQRQKEAEMPRANWLFLYVLLNLRGGENMRGGINRNMWSMSDRNMKEGIDGL